MRVSGFVSLSAFSCQQVHVLKYETLFLNLYQASLHFEGSQTLNFFLRWGHILEFFSSLRWQMFSITDEHFYTYICLIEMIITEMYPLNIKIEYIVFLSGSKWRSFPWSYSEFKKTKQKGKL